MADNLNFKKGEYRNATPGLFSEGDIVLGRLPQPVYSEMGFANKSGCMPRAEVLCLKTEDSYSPNGRISCLSPIMPGPGIGFLIGTGMKTRPIYGMTSFNTKMSNDGLILNMALHAHDGVTNSADSSTFGTAFANFDVGLIPAASATQTGVVTTSDQRFDGVKTFKSVNTDYGLVLTGKGIADGSTSWSSAITFKRKDNDKVIGSWMMYSVQKSVDNVNKISTAQPIFRCYNYEGKYIDIRMPICTVDSLSASTNKYLAYINAETLPTKNMIPYFSAGGSNALLKTSGHYIDSTRLSVNSTSCVTGSSLYVNGSSSFSDDIIVGNKSVSKRGTVKHFRPTYNWSGFLFDLGPKTNYLMVTIHIIGNSYKQSPTAPINSMYQFYNYPDSFNNSNYGILSRSGRCYGYDTGTLYVYNRGDNIYAYFKRMSDAQTISFSVYLNNATIGSYPTLQESGDPDFLSATECVEIDGRHYANISEGGTGVSSLTDGALLIGAGTNAIEFVPDVAKGQVLMSNGVNNNPIFGTPSMSWTNGTTDGPVFNYSINGVSIAGTAIPSASATDSGVVTIGAQTFAGNKTFTGNILPQTDITQNIGSPLQSFNTIYTKSLYLKGVNSKFNYIVSDNDTTDEDYYAKLPKHNGKITISVNGNFENTYFMPFYTTKGEAISYNNGLRYYTTKGTESTTGLGMLILGNNITNTSDNNKRGSLRLYGPNEYYTNIYTGDLIANRSVYIRDYGTDTTYFVGVDTVNGKGNATTPIYIADTGLATACDGVIITSGEQTFSGNKIFSDNLTIHSMNVNSNSIYSTTSETYSLGTETSFFSNEYVNTLNIGQVENYISLKVDENIGILSSIYLPNITEDSRLLYAKKDIQLGSPTQPIYINNKGEAIVSTEDVGNDAIPMYLKDGVFSAMSKSIGATNQPVYFDKTNGFSTIECMAISYGGTGLTSFETNKLYRYNGEKLIDTAHVIEEDKIYTDNQSMANYLGSCYGDGKQIYLSGNRSNGQRSLSDSEYGDIINFTINNIPRIHGIFCSHSTNYGTAEPTAASPVAEEGALYFKIIS